MNNKLSNSLVSYNSSPGNRSFVSWSPGSIISSEEIPLMSEDDGEFYIETPINYLHSMPDVNDVEGERCSYMHNDSNVKKKHKHYLLYQKRFNRTILNISHMNILDKIKLKYL